MLTRASKLVSLLTIAIAAIFLTNCGSLSASDLTNSGNSKARRTGALTITSTVLADATSGSGYSLTLTATGGTRPYRWTGSALPPGLTLSSSGTLSGTPTKTGSYSISVTVTDKNSATASATVSMNVVAATIAPLSTGSTTLPSAIVGSSYSTNLTASGGTAPYLWVATGSLPAGLSMNSTGAISGTPTASGSFSFGVTLTDTSSPAQSLNLKYSISVGAQVAPLAISTAIPAATAGTSYNASLYASGGTKPYAWTATSTLPSGLTLSSTGVVSGVPTSSGNFSFGVSLQDTSSPSQVATANVPVTVASSSTSSSSSTATSDGVASLPTKWIDTTMPTQTGSVTNVASGGNLQTALNNAACGDTIVLQAGATWTGNFYLPYKSCDDSHWIVIQSSALSNLPASGTRVTPSNTTNMARILTPNSQPAISTSATGALPEQPVNHYRMIGLEIGAIWDTSNPPTGSAPEVYFITNFGLGGSTAANYPHHIVLDRCYIHGGPSNQVRHGVRFAANYLAVVDSYISDLHETGSDSTGISSDMAQGPVKIVNNYISASTENILFGSTDPTITNSVPSDIEIRNNYFYKPLKWKQGDPSYAGIPWTIKNLFECKNCQRVLLEGNVFENQWAGGQAHAIVLTPRNANGNCSWCIVADVTFRYNRVSHAAGFMNILGADQYSVGGSLGPSQPAQRLSVHDNVIEDIDYMKWGAGQSSNGRFVQLVMGSGNPMMDRISIFHNTFTGNGSACNAFLTFATNSTSIKMSNLVVRDNIFPACTYSISGDYGMDLNAVTNATTSYTVTNDLFVNWAATGISGSLFIPGNKAPSSFTAVQFQNYNGGIGGNYALASASPYRLTASDGTDPGANIASVNSMLSGTTAGLYSGSQPVSGTTPDPLAITTTSLTDATQSTYYSASVAASGGTAPYNWSVASGSLPSGLSMDSAGQISGTPTTATTTSFTVKTSDSAGQSTTANLSMTVDPQTTIAPTLPSSPSGSMTTVATTDSLGNNIVKISAAGSFAVQFSDGSKAPAGPSSTGLDGFWDLKNDPNMLYNLAGSDAGLLSKDFGYPGMFEAKPSGGSIKILEQNNVRTVIQYTWPVRPYGNATYPIDPSLTGKEIWTIYRPGKVYEKFSFTNTTSSTITFDYFQYNFHTTWTRFDGEGATFDSNYWQTLGGYAPVVPSPWGFVYEQSNGANGPSRWMLHTTTQGSVMQGTPAPTYGVVNTLSGQSVPVKANFLEIAAEDTGNYAYFGQLFAGLRSKLQTGAIVAPGTDSWTRHIVLHGGDNGIVDRTTANAYAAEYRTPPALSMAAGTNSGFNYDRGCYELVASSNAVDFTTSGTLYSPAFNISSWSAGLPSTVMINGVAAVSGTDYVAVNDNGRLLIQFMGKLASGTHLQVP